MTNVTFVLPLCFFGWCSTWEKVGVEESIWIVGTNCRGKKIKLNENIELDNIQDLFIDFEQYVETIGKMGRDKEK